MKYNNEQLSNIEKGLTPSGRKLRPRAREINLGDITPAGDVNLVFKDEKAREEYLKQHLYDMDWDKE